VIAIEESSAAVAVLLVNYGIDPFFRDKPDFWHYSFTPVEIVAEFIRDGSEPCHDDMEQIMAAIRQKWPDRFMDWWCGQNKGV
jgi:hypothetical protein